MVWRYAASRTADASGNEVWEIREAYFTDDREFGYTRDEIAASGESFAELRRDLTHMLNDLDRSYLDLTIDPPVLRKAPSRRRTLARYYEAARARVARFARRLRATR